MAEWGRGGLGPGPRIPPPLPPRTREELVLSASKGSFRCDCSLLDAFPLAAAAKIPFSLRKNCRRVPIAALDERLLPIMWSEHAAFFDPRILLHCKVPLAPVRANFLLQMQHSLKDPYKPYLDEGQIAVKIRNLRPAASRKWQSLGQTRVERDRSGSEIVIILVQTAGLLVRLM